MYRDTVGEWVSSGAAACDIPRQPEVEDLHPAVGGDEDVVGLEVAVDDPRPVRSRKAVGNGRADLRRLAPSHRTTHEPLAQGLALEQLGDRVGDAILGAEIVDGEDIRMIEPGDRLGLSLEARDAFRVLSDRCRQHLDRHVPIEPLVARPVDLAHPTLADLLDDAVVAEGATDEVSHC